MEALPRFDIALASLSLCITPAIGPGKVIADPLEAPERNDARMLYKYMYRMLTPLPYENGRAVADLL